MMSTAFVSLAAMVPQSFSTTNHARSVCVEHVLEMDVQNTSAAVMAFSVELQLQKVIT